VFLSSPDCAKLTVFDVELRGLGRTAVPDAISIDVFEAP